MYDEVIARVIAALGFDESTVHELADHLGENALGEAGVSPHLAEMVLESHQGSSFGTNGMSSIAPQTAECSQAILLLTSSSIF